MDALEKAIRNALDHKIIIFCTAGDCGNIGGLEYPWTFNQHGIFRIGAATVDGQRYNRTGDRQVLTFIAPGLEIVMRNPGQEGTVPADFKEKTGSSIATALTAGLAALILSCFRIGAIHTEQEMQSSSHHAVGVADFMAVTQPEKMHAVMRLLTSERSGNEFLEVWRSFGQASQDLKAACHNGSIQGRSEPGIISDLARDLLTGPRIK
jgi:Subtilase family